MPADTPEPMCPLSAPACVVSQDDDVLGEILRLDASISTARPPTVTEAPSCPRALTAETAKRRTERDRAALRPDGLPAKLSFAEGSWPSSPGSDISTTLLKGSEADADGLLCPQERVPTADGSDSPTDDRGDCI